VTGVELTDGTKLEADLVLIGVGIQPSTQFVGREIEMARDGAIEVNPFLRTSHPDIFAAGDVARFPYWMSGEKI
jgi:NADPH-dependent 2,4-dienoyl-CoA reductase/sulfur reductase-like enzyme